MPCEACNIQFTVFKRKKSCTECRRLYCSNCLTKTKERILCKRCVVFTTRPLSKIELLKLKAKDLIFYLQSKHISTTGCVEKEELVNLVLIHVDNSTNSFSPDSQSTPTSFSMGTDQSDDARSNPFDQIRNTCQNLFSTFTEKIAADFNFDFKQNQSDQRQSNVCEDQPRHSDSFRNVPSFNSMNGSTGGGVGSPPPPSAAAAQQKSPTSPPAPSSLNGSATTQNSSNSQPSSATTINASHLPSTTRMKSTATTTTISHRRSNGQQQPIASTSATKSAKPANTKITELTQIDCCNDAGSGCECSDDELILKFRERYGDQPLSPTTGMATAVDQITTSDSTENTTTTVATIPAAAAAVAATDSSNLPASASTSSSTTGTTKTGNSTLNTPNKDDAAFESSDISSFEDLGAVGGLQAATALPSTSDTDKWQIVNPNTWNIDDTASSSSIVDTVNGAADAAHNISYTTNLPNSITDELPQTNLSENQRQQQQQQSDAISDRDTFHVHSTSEQSSETSNQNAQQQQQQPQPNRPTDLRSKLEKTFRTRQAHRKITRRQSDGIVYSASTSNGSTANDASNGLSDLDDEHGLDDDGSSTSEDVSSHKRAPNKPCRKCGKTKGNLKKYIARFRNQLETTTAFSETEIRLQLAAFLEFVENHSAFDSKDEESVANTELEQSPSQFVELEVFDDDDDEDDGADDFDDDTGIHVYGSNDDTNTSSHPPRQFFDLNSVEKKEELDELTVKQLKEVLMLNRVDFKGCCEKTELLERVQRLWDDLQNCPAVDKLATSDLCKICMDAAIECVLLECGHMATCTSCGKVLSECPICRQYIVRVVRFFKA